MALALVGTPAVTPQTNSVSGNVIFSLPGSIAPGDLLVAKGMENNGKSLVDSGGWHFQSGGTGPQRWVGYKIADGTEGATATLAISGGGSTTFQMVVERWTGYNATTPLGTLVAGQRPTENPYTLAAGALTVTGGASSVVLNWWGATNANRSISGAIDSDQDLIASTTGGVTDGCLHAAYEDVPGSGNAAYATTMSGTRDWYYGIAELFADGGTPVSQSFGCSSENLKGVAVAPTESTETVAGVAASRATVSESLQGVTASKALSSEDLQGVAHAPVLLTENVAGVAAAKALSSEDLQGIARAPALVTENLAGVATARVLSSESLKALAPAVTAPTENLMGGVLVVDLVSESLQGVARSQVLQSENTGGVVVALSMTIPTESLAGVAAARGLSSESLGAVARSVTAATEDLLGVTRGTLVNTESTQGIARAIAAASENLRGIAAARSAPTESLGAVLRQLALPTEALQGVARAVEAFTESGGPFGFVVIIVREEIHFIALIRREHGFEAFVTRELSSDTELF